MVAGRESFPLGSAGIDSRYRQPLGGLILTLKLGESKKPVQIRSSQVTFSNFRRVSKR